MKGIAAASLAGSARALGKRERRKSATRAELIRAGRQLFSEKGLYEARIEDVAIEAGIAKGTVYTYFSDKDELIRAVAAAAYAELEAQVARSVRRVRSEPEVLRHAVRAHLEFFAANADLMRILHQVRGMLKFDRPEWQPLRDTMNAYLAALARILAVAPRLARMRAEDQRLLAGVLFGAISGVTSVQATSELHARGARGARALVDSLAAMALAYAGSAAVTPRR